MAPRKLPLRIAPYVWAAAVLWTAVFAAWHVRELTGARDQVRSLATAQARSAWQKDLLYRRWVAGHGGVYVPVTPDTQPNPWLEVPHRDVETTGGLHLTLINPAYMNRQVFGLSREGEIAGRVTSRRPLNPGNTPDPWERRALERVEAGAAEVAEEAVVGGEPALRFMAPMPAEDRCLRCHTTQGYALGDVVGGITVTVPLAGIRGPVEGRLRERAWWLGGLWLLGLAGLGAGGVVARRGDRERARHEEASRTASERLSVALHGGEVGLWEWELETDRMRWDDRALPPFSRRPVDVPDLAAVLALTHPGDLEEHRRKTAACKAGASDQLVLEYRYRAADGSWRWVHTRGRLVERHPDGRPRRFAGTIADVTALRTAEDERARLERELSQARRVEALGQLAGGVAHDLNNLLSPILGNTSLALEQLPGDDPIRDDLLEIRGAAERARDLTRRLLAFGRRQQLALEPVDVAALLEGLRRMLATLVPAGVELAVRAEASMPPALADRSQLEVALVNLVANARDSMPQGGRLGVAAGTARLDAARAARLELAPGDYVSIEVTDEGAGMDPATLERIFEPFFTTKAIGKGTGLGLPSVYGFLRQLGGGVEVESVLGAGSTFRMLLPMTPGPARGRAPDAPVPRGAAEVVLVVEDDDAVRRYVAGALASQGYTVRTAARGEAALDLLDSDPRVDLVLTDVVMPGMPGPELAARAAERAPHTAILFMSGYPRLSSGTPMPPPGTPVLTKPFTPADLARAVRQALDARRHAAPA